MITKLFKISEDFSSITFNQDSAQALAERLNSFSGGKYRVNGITVAFPLAGHTHYPLKPEEYPLSGVPIGDIPSKEALASLSPKVLTEPKLFHLTGENIELIVVQQNYIRELVSQGERYSEVDETYLDGTISVQRDYQTTKHKLAFISRLEQLIREHSKVQKHKSIEAAYNANLASLTKRELGNLI